MYLHARHSTYFNSVNLQNTSTTDTIIICILQMGKLKHRAVKQFSKGHTAISCNWNSDPSRLAPESTLKKNVS